MEENSSTLLRAFVIGLLLCSPVWAQTEAEARALLEQSRPAEALRLSAGSSLEGRILRCRALLETQRYDEAEPLLAELSGTSIGTLSPSQAFEMMMLRAQGARVRRRYELAIRLAQDSLSFALTPEQNLEALDAKLIALLGSRDFPEAEEVIQRAQSLVPEVQSTNRLAQHMLLVAQLAEEQGRRAEAVAARGLIRASYREADLPVKAAYLSNALGTSLYREGHLSASLQQFSAGTEQLMEAGYPEGALAVLPVMVQTIGQQMEKGPEILEQVRRIADRMPSGWARDRARLHLAQALMMVKEPEAASAILDSLEQPSVEPIVRASALKLKAQLANRAGEPEESLALYDRALSLSTSRPASDSLADASLISLWRARGVLLREQRRFPEALASFEKAAAVETSPDWATTTFAARQELVTTHLAAYDLDAASRAVADAVPRVQQFPLQAEKAIATILLLAALEGARDGRQDRITVLQPLQDFDSLSRALFRELFAGPGARDALLGAMEDWKTSLERTDDTSQLAVAYYWRGNLLRAAERWAEARTSLEKAEALAGPAGLTTIRLVALETLAEVEHATGDEAAATAALERATKLARGLTPRVYQSVSYLLGAYLRSRGDFAGSLRAYQVEGAEFAVQGAYGRALALEGLGRQESALAQLEAIAAESVSGKPISAAAVSALQGRILDKLGDSVAAESLMAQGLEGLRSAGGAPRLVVEAAVSYARLLVEGGRQEEALTLVRQILDPMLEVPGQSEASAPLLPLAVELALHNDQVDLAFHYLEASRSAELVASTNLADLGQGAPAALERLAELKLRLAALQAESEAEDAAQRQQASRVLAATRAEFFQRLDELKRQRPEFEALVKLSGSDLSVIQQSLPPDEVLVEYFPAEDRLYLFTVTRDKVRMDEVSVGRAELDRLVRAYVTLVREPSSSLAQVQAASRGLHSLLLEPAAPALSGRSRLRVVPSGPLWLVPFGELRDAQGETLDERIEVSFLTSADVLRSLAVGKGEAKGSVVLLGAPQQAGLPGAQGELRSLSALFSDSVTLSGAEATSTALQARAPKAKILHIASHSGLDSATGSAYVSLADGAFPLSQVYGLSLPPGAMVVLSSCQSAVGESAPGREITSLASAFNIAGASTVIASQWEVDDAATRRLFEIMYQRLKAGDTRGQALRHARREIAREHPHPFYWAAFSLFGSPK